MQVSHLTKGQLFTLPVEDNNTIYVFNGNVFLEGTARLDYSLITPVAGWWPANARGHEQPAQWVSVGGNPGERICNPYAKAKPLSSIKKEKSE